jgi:hypothetical protein
MFRRTACAASRSPPRPAGFRFYHTHLRAGADLQQRQNSGQVGPVYIELRASAHRDQPDRSIVITRIGRS